MRKSRYGVNITEAAKKLGVSPQAIQQRIKYGWSVEKALSTPFIPLGKRNSKPPKYKINVKKTAEKLGITIDAVYKRLRDYNFSEEKAANTGKYDSLRKIKPVDCCDKLKNSLSNLYGTIDKILQSKIAMRKLAKLPELAEHFTTLSKADNEAIDEAIGGIKVYILNNPKPDKEFIYNVVGTDGQTLRTNDKAEFMAFMAEVA